MEEYTLSELFELSNVELREILLARNIVHGWNVRKAELVNLVVNDEEKMGETELRFWCMTKPDLRYHLAKNDIEHRYAMRKVTLVELALDPSLADSLFPRNDIPVPSLPKKVRVRAKRSKNDCDVCPRTGIEHCSDTACTYLGSKLTTMFHIVMGEKGGPSNVDYSELLGAMKGRVSAFKKKMLKNIDRKYNLMVDGFVIVPLKERRGV